MERERKRQKAGFKERLAAMANYVCVGTETEVKSNNESQLIVTLSKVEAEQGHSSGPVVAISF